MLILRKIFLLLCLLPSISFAAFIFGSANINPGFMMADDDFNNGSGAFGYGFAAGFVLPFGNPEVWYKDYTFTNYLETKTGGKYDIKITDTAYGAGFRFFPLPYFSSKFGYGMHTIKATYVPRAGTAYRSTIDGEHTGLYLGLGADVPFYTYWALYADCTYFPLGNDLAIFDIEFGLRLSY